MIFLVCANESPRFFTLLDIFFNVFGWKIWNFWKIKKSDKISKFWKTKYEKFQKNLKIWKNLKFLKTFWKSENPKNFEDFRKQNINIWKNLEKIEIELFSLHFSSIKIFVSRFRGKNILSTPSCLKFTYFCRSYGTNL